MSDRARAERKRMAREQAEWEEAIASLPPFSPAEIEMRRAHAKEGADAALADETLERFWWWLSFADTDAPAGQQFLGVAIVDAPITGDELVDAGLPVQRAWDLDANPGGQVQIVGPFSDEEIAPNVPPECRRRLLRTRADLDAIGADIDGLEAVGGSVPAERDA